MATHNEVAHAWANQTGKHRNGFNMYYEGDTIYSYGSHFPIARLVQTDERQVVLFTTDSHSVSTAKHKTITWRACYHMRVFSVPLVRTSFVHNRDQHAYNVQSYVSRIMESLEKAKRARVYGPSHMADAEGMIREVQDYIRVFDVPGFDHMVWEPDAIVAGAREAARLQQKREEEVRKQREAEAKRRYREETWPAIKEWLRGHKHSPHLGARYMPTSRPLPRVWDNKVETTWGASVPLEDARNAYWLAVRCRRAHKGFIPGGPRTHVGDFALREVKANGDLVIGCHDIPFWFMRYAACRAGIPAEPPRELVA